MINRNDVLAVPGGDTIQMLQTKHGLGALGVEVVLGSVDDMNLAGNFDLIHLFNWELLPAFMQRYRDLRFKEAPVVLSPIFWFHTGHWYDQAAKSTPAWKAISRVCGKTIGRQLYENWQAKKFSLGRGAREYRRDFARVAHILPNSEAESNYMASVLRLPDKLFANCTVVPNAVERRLFEPIPEPSGAFLEQYCLRDFVLQVGRIQSAKNQLALIRALFDVEVPIVLVGQASPYEIAYVEECRRLGTKRGNVHILGSKVPEELPGIYRLAAVHVLPSWRETPGLASLEAAACGCQVVSTRIGSAMEYFGAYAEYCDPGSTRSIRSAVLRALAKPRSRGLREHILSNYTWEQTAATTLSAYKKVMAGSGK